MTPALRRPLSALGLAAAIALGFGAAASTALSIYDQKEEVARLSDQVVALQAREAKLHPRTGPGANASPAIKANTVTLAGAALQQRFEEAVASAHGRLISSKVDVAPRGDARRVTLAAELTIAEPDMQSLLFDLETGRPYLFVDALEARAPEPGLTQEVGVMRVSLNLSAQWSGSK